MKYLLVFFVFCILSSCILNRNKGVSAEASCSKYYDEALKMDVYTSADDFPRYPTGEIDFYLFLKRNYKGLERVDGMRWTIKVSFIIDKTGKTRNARISDQEVKDYSAIEIEALRIINLMPKWKPARCKGKKVAFLYRVPLRVEPR